MAEGGGSKKKERPMKERFDTAVSVIKSLPKEGPFQPSNTVKLRFYALYKQSTEGPCTIPKPSFWDAVGRAKWEAWTVCGKMSSELAMQIYVEELQQLIATMPQTPEIEQFLESIAPYSEEGEVADTGPQGEGKGNEEAGERGGAEGGGEGVGRGSEETGERGGAGGGVGEGGASHDDDVESDHPTLSASAAEETSQAAQEDKTINSRTEGGVVSAESDEDSDAFQESFQELPVFPSTGSAGSRNHVPNHPTQTPRVGFTLPHEERGVESDSAGSRVQSQETPNTGENVGALEDVLPQLLTLQTSLQSVLRQLTSLISTLNPSQLQPHPQPHPQTPLQSPVRSRRVRVFFKLVPFLLSWPIFHQILVRFIINRYGSPSSTWWLFSLITFVHTIVAAAAFTIAAQMLR